MNKYAQHTPTLGSHHILRMETTRGQQTHWVHQERDTCQLTATQTVQMEAQAEVVL